MVEAAQAPEHGKAMIRALLDLKNDLDSGTLTPVLRGCVSMETLGTLLAHSQSIVLTEVHLEAAVQNAFLNPELTEMILRRTPGISVSEKCIVFAICPEFSFPTSRTTRKHTTLSAIIEILLNHPDICDITEELICKVARWAELEDLYPRQLLLSRCLPNCITEDVLMAAAANMKGDSVILEFMLNKSASSRECHFQ